jgi:hypothetical protein
MKAEPGAVGHMAAPELPSRRGRAQSHGTCGSAEAHLSKERHHLPDPEFDSGENEFLGLY